uniref:Reverse transcriptase domain-containing protein n=1 Tax=Strongyloides venezuelensis TaxID=75913 RepID=A0A0K0FS07_STRVS
MAPPGKNPLPDFNSFPNKSAYVRLVRNFCRGKEEDEAIELICRIFPKTMIDSYYNRFLDESFEGEMNAEELLEHVENYVKDQDLKDTLWDKAKAAYDIRFSFGSQEACQKLLIELYGRFRVMLKGMEKNEVQRVVVTRFLSLIPPKMGRKLIEKFENPTYDDVLKFAADSDKKYDVEKRSKNQDQRKRDFKDKEKKEFSKGNLSKPIKRLDNGENKDDKEESKIKIAFFFKDEINDVSNAIVNIDGYGDVTMYLDSCSSINIIPKALADKLLEKLGDVSLVNAESFSIKGIHESYSKTCGALELRISIPNSLVNKEKIVFYIDKEAISPLLSKNFLKKFNINPVDYDGSKTNSDFNGMVIDQASDKFISLLKSMPLLYDDKNDYPNNVCKTSFTISNQYYPVRKKIIPVSKELDEHVRSNIEKQIKKGWLEPVPVGTMVDNVNSMVIVKKDKNEDPVRVCFNCTHINKFLTIPEDSDELPSIKDLLHVDVDRISLYDIRSAFNRIDVEEECRQYLVLGTPYGMFRSKVLVFGLKLSPYIWMKTIKKVLEPVIEHIKIYYDDIVNVAKGKLHDEINCKIIECLNKVNMQLTPNKCAIGVNKGIFLGYLIECPLKISIPKDRVEALLQLPCPKNSKEVMELMGRFQYFAAMIPNFAELTAPIHDFKNRKGEFQKELYPHFELLKRATAKSVSLEAIRNNCKNLVIYASFSDIAICSIMKACYKDEMRIFAVGGRKLRASEKNYGKPEKVLLAVREIIAQNKYISANFEILVYSEVQGIQKAWDSEIGMVSSTFQRLMYELKAFNLNFIYVKGNRNDSNFLLKSNYSSNISQATSFIAKVENDFDYFPISPDELKKEYFSDKDAILLGIYISEGFLPESKKLELNYALRSKLDKVECKNGIIYVEDKLLIPFNLRSKLVDYLHRYHASFDQMSRNVKVNFVGNKILSLLKEKANTCDICLTFRRNSRKQISEWPKTDDKRERFHADCAEYGKHLFMVNCDAHTGYCAAVVIKGVSSKDIIAAYSDTYERIETPLIQVADNGRGFCATQTREYLKDLGIVVLFSVPRCPESNGIAEKCIGLIKGYLDKHEKKESFKILLQKAVNAVNNRVVDGISIKRKFFGYSDKELVTMKYNFKSYPFACNIKYKLDRGEKTWNNGKCLERIGNNMFRITDDEEKNVYIRKADSIMFLDKRGTVTSVDQINKLVYQEKENVIETSEMNVSDEPDKEYIKIESEQDFQNFRLSRPDFRLFLSIDGSTEKGKGYGGVIWGYINNSLPEVVPFRGSKGLASSAQFLEVSALEEGLKKLESDKNDERFKGKLAIVTDSDYVGRSVTCYLSKWEKTNFITTKGSKVKHEQQWKNILSSLTGWKEIIVLKAAAHKDILINEAADMQSKLGAAESISKSSITIEAEEGDD